MSDERVTPYDPAASSRTTVVQEGPERSSPGAAWLFGIVLLIAVLTAVYFLAVRGGNQNGASPALRHGEAAQDAASDPVSK
jgi:hypothetical protein